MHPCLHDQSYFCACCGPGQSNSIGLDYFAVYGRLKPILPPNDLGSAALLLLTRQGISSSSKSRKFLGAGPFLCGRTRIFCMRAHPRTCVTRNTSRLIGLHPPLIDLQFALDQRKELTCAMISCSSSHTIRGSQQALVVDRVESSPKRLLCFEAVEREQLPLR